MAERPVVTRSRGGFVVHLRREERDLVGRLLGELGTLLTDPHADQALVGRLFPVVHPDDPDLEAEYQRLMREELVSSRLAAIESVQQVLGRSGRSASLTELEMGSFMQGINAIRLVLGTLLGVSDDDEDALDFAFADDAGRADADEDDADDADDGGDTAEHHLYGYLSWLLDAAVLAHMT